MTQIDDQCAIVARSLGGRLSQEEANAWMGLIALTINSVLDALAGLKTMSDVLAQIQPVDISTMATSLDGMDQSAKSTLEITQATNPPPAPTPIPDPGP